MLAFATLKGAGWLILSRFFARGIDFFNLLVLARLLAPADFGLTALAMALVMIIDTILEVPVTQALLRLGDVDKSHLDTGFTLAVMRSIGVATVTLACAWPYAWLNSEPALISVVCVLAIGPVVKGLYSPAMVHLARRIDFMPSFVVEMTAKLFALACALTIAFGGGGYWAIIANYVVAACVTTVLSYLIARYRPAFSFLRIKDFAGFMGWWTTGQVLSAVNWQYDRLMIGAYSGDKAMLGHYSVANELAVIPVQSLIGPAFQPMMAAFSQMRLDVRRLGTAFLKATRLAMMVSVPACLGISLTSDLVAELLLGVKWIDAAPYLTLLAIAVLPATYIQTIGAVSLAMNRPDLVFKINLIDMILRIPAVTIGYHYLSIEGVVYAKMITSAVMFAVYIAVMNRLLHVGTFNQLRNLWKIAFAGVAMALAVFVLRRYFHDSEMPTIVEMLLSASVGAIVYGGSLLALGTRLSLGRGKFELADRW